MHGDVGVGVDVEGDPDAGVTEDRADDLGIDAFREHQSGVAVAEIMKTDLRETADQKKGAKTLVEL